MTTKKSNPALILLGICVLIVILNIDYTAVNLAIVDISIETNAPLSTLQWMLSGYVLAWAAIVVPFGKMADIYGKRRLLLIGVWVFMIASALIGIGDQAWQLILGRIFQGIGGALFVPPCYALVFENFSKDRQGFAIGMIGTAAGVGLAFGPSMSGFILEYLSWRWLFYINIPLGFFVIGMLLYSAKKEPLKHGNDNLNYTLSSILTLATICLFYGLDKTNYTSNGFEISKILYPGVIGFIAFMLFNLKSKNPLLPSIIVKNTAYWGIVVGFFAHQFTFSMTFFLSNLYLQNTLGHDAFMTGQIFIALTISLGFLSALGGTLVDKFGIKMPATVALLLMAISCLLYLNFGLDTSIYYVLLVLFMMGLGMGLAISPYNTGVMQVVDNSSVTTATSFFVMFNLIAHTLAIIFASNFVTEFSKTKLVNLIQAQLPLATDGQILFMNKTIEKTDRSIELYNSFAPDIALKMFNIVESSYLSSMHILFGICSVMCFFAVFLSLRFLPKK